MLIVKSLLIFDNHIIKNAFSFYLQQFGTQINKNQHNYSKNQKPKTKTNKKNQKLILPPLYKQKPEDISMWLLENNDTFYN